MSLSELDRAIEMSPVNHDAYSKRADAQIGLGRTTLALEDLGQAIRLAPTNTDYLYDRGELYYQSAEYDLAFADFDRAVVLKQRLVNVDPKHIRPIVGRGKAYLQLGQPKRALDDSLLAILLLGGNLAQSEWKRKTLEINLQLADAHELLGDVYIELSQPDSARTEYGKAAGFR